MVDFAWVLLVDPPPQAGIRPRGATAFYRSQRANTTGGIDGYSGGIQKFFLKKTLA